MSKPLLTDDVIEQAKRGEIDLEEHPYYQDYEEEFYDEDSAESEDMGTGNADTEDGETQEKE